MRELQGVRELVQVVYTISELIKNNKNKLKRFCKLMLQVYTIVM